jgi:DNA-binding protein H-NS
VLPKVDFFNRVLSVEKTLVNLATITQSMKQKLHVVSNAQMEQILVEMEIVSQNQQPDFQFQKPCKKQEINVQECLGKRNLEKREVVCQTHVHQAMVDVRIVV